MSRFITIRDRLDAAGVAEFSMLLYLTGFFFFPSSNMHKNFFYLAVLTPFLLTVRRQDLQQIFASRVLRWCVVYLLYIYLTLFWSEATTLSDYSRYLFRLLNTLVFLMAVYRLIANDAAFLERIWYWVVRVAALMATISIVVFYSEHSFPLHRLENWGPLYHAIVGGSCYGLAAVVCYFRFLRVASDGRRWLYMLFLAILLIDVWLTMSRGVWLGLAVAFLAGELMHRNYWLAVLPVVLVLGYTGLVLSGLIEPSWFLVRDGGDTYRLATWARAMERVADAPWFGFGVNTDESVRISADLTLSHAHSVYVSNLLYGGITALVLLFGVILSSLRAGIAASWCGRQGIFLAIGVFAFVCIATDNHQLLMNPAQLWLFFWFPVAVLAAMELRLSRAGSDKC